MATLVCFHAHPDDEAIATGGTMARAAAEGVRVVLVVATGGELGEIAEFRARLFRVRIQLVHGYHPADLLRSVL